MQKKKTYKGKKMLKHLDFHAEAFICEFQSAQENIGRKHAHTHENRVRDHTFGSSQSVSQPASQPANQQGDAAMNMQCIFIGVI